jgi:hypothetical protein
MTLIDTPAYPCYPPERKERRGAFGKKLFPISSEAAGVIAGMEASIELIGTN